jgi:hypothetical protein
MAPLDPSVGTAVPNRSEPDVPKRSEAKAGRPAVVSDSALLQLAGKLNTDLGRPPRADELIAAAGGCQKQRALAAIRELKLDLAERAVRSQLRFAPAIEHDLRALCHCWLDHAANQLAELHRDQLEQFETREKAQRAFIEEQQTLITDLREQVLDREQMLGELTQRLQDLQKTHLALQEQVIEARSVAAERLRLIEGWEAVKTSAPSGDVA